MAHFAKLDSNNIVIFVTVGRDEDNEVDISARTGHTYKSTSYNTRGGVHYGQDGQPDNGVALRANYAGLGYIYDATNDVFYAPRPTDRNNIVCESWTISAPTWIWTPPTPMPTDNNKYGWDETTQSWVVYTTQNETPIQSAT